MARILVGTVGGIHEIEGSGARRPSRPGLPGEVTAVALEADRLWAVVGGRAVWRTEGPDRWVQVADLEELRATCLAGTRAGVLVGTSAAHLARPAGEGLELVGSFDEAPGRERWFTPWGGPPDTRSISDDGEAGCARTGSAAPATPRVVACRNALRVVVMRISSSCA